MNDSLKILDDLARRARLETAPAADVSAGVLARLRRTEDPWELFYTAFAAGSAAAAVLVAAVSGYALYEMTDPFLAMFQITPVFWL